MIFSAASTGGLGGIQILGFAMIFLIFYLFIIRPQTKKQNAHNQMLAKLKKGQKVVTSGGIHGVIMNVREQTIMLKVAEKVYIELQKGNIGQLLSGDKEED